MHYFIDGYNLMFRLSRAGGDLKTQREEIIQDLEIKINTLGINATLVFDAQYQPDESSRSHIMGLEILFTNAGETADDFILHALKEDTKPHRQTVVTSDKKLAWLARRSHANTETIEEFVALLNRRYKNKLRPKKTKQYIPSVTPKRIIQTQQPVIEASPEDCFDYYLDQFQKSFAVIDQEKQAKREAKKIEAERVSKRKSRKRSPSPPRKEESQQSLEQRWLSAFNRDISKD